MLRKNIRAICFAAVASMLMGSVAHADPVSDFLDSIFNGQTTGHMAKNNVVKRGRSNFRVSQVRESHTVYHSMVGNSVLASFYGHGEKLNSHTASGERFNPYGFTAAHRSLPLGTKLLVTHNGRQVVVRINDRGPASWTGRSLDLSYGAARAIGLTGAGVGSVHIAQLN